MRVSQVNGHARYSPEYADSETIYDPTLPFSPDSAPRGSGALRFPVNLNATPVLHRTGSTAGHVTEGTGLPRSFFPDANTG